MFVERMEVLFCLRKHPQEARLAHSLSLTEWGYHPLATPVNKTWIIIIFCLKETTNLNLRGAESSENDDQLTRRK